MYLQHSTRYLTILLLGVLFTAAGCNGDGSDNDSGGEPEEPRARARQVSDADDLLHGPLARGREGDFVLENDHLRVIIQQAGRNPLGLGTYGGNIIDVSIRNPDGSFNPDHFEELITGVNIENTPNFTDIRIENDGADGEPAEICASGPDDLIDIFNASSILREFGATLPESADDRDLPVLIETCYTLAPQDTWITLDTKVTNQSAEALLIYMTDYVNGSGEVETFQPGVGFGEPLLTATCPAASYLPCTDGECDQCNFIAYAGNGGAQGVSYGFIHEVPETSSISTARISGLLMGLSAIDLLLGGADPNFEIPANGELHLRRYFAMGDGDVNAVAEIRNRIFGIDTGELSGTVTSGGQPLAEADVSVFKTLNDNAEPPARFVVNHSRTDAEGQYSMSLPPGDYQVQAHKEGFLYASDDPAVVSIAVDQAVAQDFDLPSPGMLQVSVTERIEGAADRAIPAKLQLVGFDPAPPLLNGTVGGVTGVFGNNVDRMPYGIALTGFIDRSGVSDVYMVEPGDYQVVVSRGPRYSAFRQNVTIASGQTAEIQAELAKVLETPNLVSADFHVHSIDSWDAEVTREERVATYLAEGMDFFTPSDHGIRVDFTDTLLQMDVSDLIGTASSSEVTTWDYGHFNSWPVTLNSTRLNGGSVDWGGEAPPGEDFPSYGSYSLLPVEIFAEALADPMDNVVQINHIASHFGELGLAIDTGLTPPQSQADLLQNRLDPSTENAFDDGFQALEVWIGTDGREGIFGQFLGQNVGDWFNLINQGLVRTGIANSDSHERRTTFLANRNLIASEETDPGNLSDKAEELAAAVAAGKTVGTNGPTVSIEATGRYLGIARTASLGVDEPSRIPISNGSPLTLRVNISTPAWAPVDSVDFYVNNQPERTSADTAAARYGVCADYSVSAGDVGWEETEVVVIAGLDGATRTDITVTQVLPGITEDTWVVAIVHGTDGVSSPMFPVVPEDLDQASNQTLEDLLGDNIGEGGVPAYAFTNPLFIDEGNNGWTAPGVANAACSSEE